MFLNHQPLYPRTAGGLPLIFASSFCLSFVRSEMVLFIASSSFFTKLLLSFSDFSSWVAVCFCCCKISISLSRTLSSFCCSAFRSSSFWNTLSKLSSTLS
uniref:Uncharacterized protein n=1 Tax=Anopheles albimanus TaxID=7167 RepID=A0A182FXU4_ANOAL